VVPVVEAQLHKLNPFSKVWNVLGNLDDQIGVLCQANEKPHPDERKIATPAQADSNMDKDLETALTMPLEHQALLSEALDSSILDHRLVGKIDALVSVMEDATDSDPDDVVLEADARSFEAAVGRFSQVWAELDSFDLMLQNSSEAKSLPLDRFRKRSRRTSREVKETWLRDGETIASKTELTAQQLTIVTPGGSVLGKYNAAKGTVGVLKAQVAESIGSFPFTLQLVLGSEILDDSCELARLSSDYIEEELILTLVQCCPTIGSGSFSKVWDIFGNLDERLGSIGGVIV
jgi:hypothetical protein